MRPALLMILFCLAFRSPVLATGEGAPCSLKILNHDIIHGSLLHVSPQTGIKISSPSFNDTVEINLRKILSLDLLENKMIMDNKKNGKLLLKLINGDSMPANSVIMQKSGVNLNSRFLGTIPISPSLLDSIRFNHARPNTNRYDGFKNLDDWNLNRRGPTCGCAVKDDTLIVKGMVYLSAKFKIPPSARVDFDITMDSAVYIFLHPKSSKRYPSRCYALSLFLEDESIYFFENNKGERQVGKSLNNTERFRIPRDSFEEVDENSDDERKKRPMHVTILADKTNNSLLLYLNYIPALKRSNLKNLSGDGAGLALLFNQYDSLNKVKNFVVREWKADIPILPPPPKRNTESHQRDCDTILMSNKDRLSGKILALDEKSATFQMKHAEMKIPINEILHIFFAMRHTSTKTKTTRPRNFVRTIFTDGTVLSMRFKSIDTSKLLGDGLFKEIKLPISLIKRFEFNLPHIAATDKTKSKFFADIPIEKIKTCDDSIDDDDEDDNEDENDFFDNF